MKKLLLTLALLLAPSLAWAQCNGVFPNNTVCGNATGSSNTPRATSPNSFPVGPAGTSGQIQYNNNGVFGGFTATGDASIIPSPIGLVTLTPTGVIAGTYGTPTQIAKITVDAKGRATTVTAVAITYPAVITPLSMQFRSPMDPPWNAACDGVTDDRTAVQTWINAIAGLYWGYVPANRLCGISQFVFVPTNTGIFGDKTSGFRCINGANAACGLLLTDNPGGGTAPGPGFVTIKGMIFDGNFQNRTGPFSYAGIYAYGVRHVRILDNYLINCAADCIDVGGNATTTTVSTDVIVDGNYADNASRNPGSFFGGDIVSWTNNRFSHGGTAPGTCLDVEPDSINTVDSNFIIAHNIFHNCINGLAINPGNITNGVVQGWGFANISNSNTQCGYTQFFTPTTISGFKMAGAGGSANGTGLLCAGAFDALP